MSLVVTDIVNLSKANYQVILLLALADMNSMSSPGEATVAIQ